jgi:hypothetical protein
MIDRPQNESLKTSPGRGTGEPGPFGAVVGDPLIAAVTKQLPGSRGYAVQVGIFLRSDSSNITLTVPSEL